MKKIIILIFINFAVLCFLFTILNFVIYFAAKNGDIDKLFPSFNLSEINNNTVKSLDPNLYETEDIALYKRLFFSKELFKKFCGEKRLEYGANKYKNKRPIIINGCSYAYGHGLKREETFAYFLSETTKRPVISFANCAIEAIGSLRAMRNYSYRNNKMLENSEYVIYIYMYDHINRYVNLRFLYIVYDFLFPSTKIKKKLLKIPLIKYLFVVAKQREIVKDFPETRKAEEYLKLILDIWAKNIKEMAPNAQIIILIYDDKIPKRPDNMNNIRTKTPLYGWYNNAEIKYVTDIKNSKIWDDFAEKTGAKIVHSKELMGFSFDYNYKLSEDYWGWHPNKRAWEELTPRFVEKLDIK